MNFEDKRSKYHFNQLKMNKVRRNKSKYEQGNIIHYSTLNLQHQNLQLNKNVHYYCKNNDFTLIQSLKPTSYSLKHAVKTKKYLTIHT